jgi:hypothetical protein
MRTGLTVFVVGLAVLGSASLASAQDQSRARVYRHVPLRVHVTPAGRLLYRQCFDRPVVEHRATGDTVVPRTQCWWAVR